MNPGMLSGHETQGTVVPGQWWYLGSGTGYWVLGMSTLGLVPLGLVPLGLVPLGHVLLGL